MRAKRGWTPGAVTALIAGTDILRTVPPDPSVFSRPRIFGHQGCSSRNLAVAAFVWTCAQRAVALHPCSAAQRTALSLSWRAVKRTATEQLRSWLLQTRRALQSVICDSCIPLLNQNNHCLEEREEYTVNRVRNKLSGLSLVNYTRGLRWTAGIATPRTTDRNPPGHRSPRCNRMAQIATCWRSRGQR